MLPSGYYRIWINGRELGAGITLVAELLPKEKGVSALPWWPV